MYRAALCGLGNIAWQFDRNRPDSEICLSHAGAYRGQAKTVLAAGFSPEKEDRDAFGQTYDLPAYDSLDELLACEKPDIVSICSPSQFHCEQVMACIAHAVPMIWLEKPPALTLAETDALKAAAAGRSTVAVNYQRRYLPLYRELRERCRSGTLGPCRQMLATYSRGLETNGSHILDILFFLAGDRDDHRLQWVSNAADPENPSFALTIGDMEAMVIGAALPYHNVDISATFDGGRLSVIHGGMTGRVEERVEHELFPGFYRLKEREAAEFSGLSGVAGGMENALQDLIDAHEKRRAPLSGLHSARRTMALMEAVRRRQGERV